ncbi:MAG: hypothetical protein JXQ82_06720 [Methanomicrobiaceae archaeon]|nr:hypothetical protein [Methanomicrobiaceae archaeon]
MTEIYSKIKFFAFLTVLIAVFALSAGCTGSTDNGTVSPTDAIETQTTPEMTETVSAPAKPAEEKNIVSGTGDKKTKVLLPKGVSLFTLVQDTPERSAVYITTEKDGISIINAYNKGAAEKSMMDGKYYWSQAFMLEEEAEAEVEVTTLSEWTLEFSFPQMINGIVPQTFSGAASKATPFFQINEGEYKFTIKAENDEFVSVSLMDYYGNNVIDNDMLMPLAFHKGSYDDSVIVKINESSNYLLNINTDGEWTVSVEKA